MYTCVCHQRELSLVMSTCVCHQRELYVYLCVPPEGAVTAGGALQEGDDEQCAAGQREADVPLPGGPAQGPDGRHGGAAARGPARTPRPLQGQDTASTDRLTTVYDGDEWA